MKTSESIKNLAKALLKAQSQMGAAVKGSKNPFYNSKYADLPTVMEVVKEPLNSAGILVLQPVSHRDGKNFIITTLIHAESGEFMQSETEIMFAKQNDAQAFGAAQTYARRFGLQAMMFIPSEDDDGNGISDKTPKAKPEPSWKKETPVVSAKVTPGDIERSGGVTKNSFMETPKTSSRLDPAVGNCGDTNVNAAFDAIKKPEQTTQPLTNGGQVASTIEPLKKSSFRNKAKAAPVVTPPTNTESGSSDWN